MHDNDESEDEADAPQNSDTGLAADTPLRGVQALEMAALVRAIRPSIDRLWQQTSKSAASTIGTSAVARSISLPVDTSALLRPLTQVLGTSVFGSSISRLQLDSNIATWQRGGVGAAMVGQFAAFTSLRKDFFPLLDLNYNQMFARVAEAIRRHWLPANLVAVDDLDVHQVFLVADEGISLYVVPRPSIAKRILLATDARTRRDVLGRALPQIMADCDATLDRCVSPETRPAVIFTRKAIAAARDGHVEAAQALVANTLDTTRAKIMDRSDRALIAGRSRASRSDLDELSIRRCLVLLPLWHAYASYRPDKGDAIPQVFNRHASAHGVSGRQFSKRNTAQGLLLVTSLIALLNDL